jgi:hypothetical protein
MLHLGVLVMNPYSNSLIVVAVMRSWGLLQARVSQCLGGLIIVDRRGLWSRAVKTTGTCFKSVTLQIVK